MHLMLVFLRGLGMQHVLLQMLHDVFSRPVLAHEPRFIFPHLPRDLVRHGVDRGIHVVGLFARFDRDVIRADEHHFGGVPVFFDLQDDVRLDDLRIIKMQALDLARAVIADRVRDL